MANDALPGYTQTNIKATLLAAGASGTIYALVMPESEKAIQAVIGEAASALFNHDQVDKLDSRAKYLEMFREPWTQKQDAMHGEYFERWIDWARPVVKFAPEFFPFRYPTAGASEGIVKLMAEYLGSCRERDLNPKIHVFEGEYEGFTAFARGLGIKVVKHERKNWRDLQDAKLDGQFWVSQPSAIDGMVWEEFGEFCQMVDQYHDGLVEVVPDLTYVGAVAREYSIDLNRKCIRSFVISHSKPFGGYYHRCGGVFAKHERPTLFGNMWFKNLTSIAWGIEMMKNYGVYDLPRKYRAIQKEAVSVIAGRLDIENLEPCDIFMVAKAPVPDDLDDVTESLIRGSENNAILRICLTPEMTVSIDPQLAPEMAQMLGDGK